MPADPYLNTDAGTMSPFEHGEVFVLDDGGEVGCRVGHLPFVLLLVAAIAVLECHGSGTAISSYKTSEIAMYLRWP